MKKFLKQRKGCKRDDSTDFRFKHQLYTFYCHRDGAARFHYNQDDAFLDLNAELRDEIEQRRQLYKINAYLNDVPLESTEPINFPFLGEDGLEMQTLGGLIQYSEKNNLFQQLKFARVSKEKNDEIIILEQVVQLVHSQKPEILIQIKKDTLHRIMVEALKGNANDMEKAVLWFGIERDHLVKLLDRKSLLEKVKSGEKVKRIQKWLDEYSLYKLRTTDTFLQEKFARWVSEFMENKVSESKTRAVVLDLLGQHPVEMRYLDFYLKQNRKPRQHNEFVKYSVQYLVDKQILSSICFQWQAFETFINKEGKAVLAEITCFQPNRPIRQTGLSANWRLKFTFDDQILFTWKEPTDPQPAGEVRSQSPKVQPFLMGHRALKNFLIPILLDKKIEATNLFFDDLKQEALKLKSGARDTLRIIHPKAIPVSLNPEERKSAEMNLKDRVDKRITYIITKLEEGLKNPPNKRAEKNRAIMECYRLFDWPLRQDGTEQFLRKNEYNLLSVYHFMMEKDKIPAIISEIKGGNKDRIPIEVVELLNQSSTLNELYQKGLETASVWLQTRRSALNFLKGKKLKDLARKLGVPIYEQVNEVKNLYTPFDIHPMLLVNALYKNELKENSGYSLSSRIWKTAELPLVHEYYETLSLLDIAPKNIRKRTIGELNTLKTQDGILFLIARQYDPSYVEVKDMHSQWLALKPLPDLKIPEPTEIFELDFSNNRKVKVQIMVKYHQLDDHMTLLSAHQAQKLAWQFLVMDQGIGGDGKPRLAKDNELRKKGVMISGEGEAKLFSIPLECLRRAVQFMEQESLLVTDAILKWEKDIIASKATLLEQGTAKFLSFIEVMEKAGIQDSNLREIRKHAFHGLVPEKWTYEMKRVSDSVIGSDLANIRQFRKERKQNWQTIAADK